MEQWPATLVQLLVIRHNNGQRAEHQQRQVSSVSKTIQLHADSLSKSKVSDRKRIHLIDNSSSYTGEYMILSYQDDIVKEYNLYGANDVRKGNVKHYANGEILTFDRSGILTQKETSNTVIKK